MGKPRNRKKCDRRKNVRLSVKLFPKQWLDYKGDTLRKDDCGFSLLDKTLKDSKLLFFDIITEKNAKVLYNASRNEPNLENFVKDFHGYISNVSKRWSTFKIGKSLNKTVPKLLGKPLNIQIRQSITYCQLRAFLKDVMSYVFTDSLLGEHNTRLFINQLTTSLFNSRNEEIIFVQSHMFRNICISKVPWFPMLCHDAAHNLLQCMLGFLCKFFLKIMLKSSFAIYDTSENIRFYRFEVWKRISDGFVEKFIEARQARMLTSFPQDYCYNLRFLPKTESLRPIERLTNTTEVLHSPATVDARAFLRILNRVLISVTESNSFVFGVSNFPQFAHKLRMFAHRNKSSSEFYMFTGDLSSCFTAMNHEFLKKALKNAIPDGPAFIYAEFVIRFKNKTYVKWAVGRSLRAAETMIRDKYNGCHITDNKNMKRITKSDLIFAINKYAIESIFKWKKQAYLCHRGIPQGSSLSSTLCKIYLSQMEKEIFMKPNNNIQINDLMGHKALLVRYMDDYLLISIEKEIAEGVVTKLITDTEDFDMKMNETKMTLTINLSHLKKDYSVLSKCRLLEPAERINWCGFAINTQSLTLLLDPSKLLRRQNISDTIKRSFENQDMKDKECCKWISKRLQLSMSLKFRCMRLCYRISRTKTKRNSMKNILFLSVKKYYLEYFRRRLYIKKSCADFKKVVTFSQLLIASAFKKQYKKHKSISQ